MTAAPALETDEITGLPPTAAIRAVGRAFRHAGAGPVGAFAVAAPAALLCGVIDNQMWMSPPLSVPMFVLLPGVLLALIAILPVRAWAGIILGGWCGGALGLALPPLDLPGAPVGPLPSPWLTATIGTVSGVIAGALLHLVYARLRPQMAMRLLAAILPGAIGSGCGAGLAVLLPGAIAGHAGWTDASLLFSAQSLGMLLVAPTIVIWWMAAGGGVLGYRGRRWELAGLIAALIVVTALSLGHWFPLQHVIGAVHVLALLVLIGARYPVRVVAPLASLEFVVFGIAWAHLPASHAGRSPADAIGFLALNLVILLLLLTILLLSSAYNTRRLAEQRLREYAQRLARAEEEQRRDSASVVRESIAQSLVGVRYALTHLERVMLTPEARAALGETLEVVREAEAGADETLHELGPQGLEDADFRTVLESQLQRLRAGSKASLELESAGALESLPAAVRRLAFRIVGELARNALGHGMPSRVRVSVRVEPGSLVIAVRDDGRGFDPVPVFTAPQGRYRLPSLRDRIAAEGGSFALQSAAGAGCVVDVRVPLQGDEPASGAATPAREGNVLHGNFGSRASRR